MRVHTPAYPSRCLYMKSKSPPPNANHPNIQTRAFFLSLPLLLPYLMEAIEFPFLNQEFDYTHLLNLLRDMDSFGGGDVGTGGWNSPTSKRLKTEEGGFVMQESGGDGFEVGEDPVGKSSSGSALRELFTSFVFMEEGAKELNFQEDNALSDANSQRKRDRPMRDYYQSQSNAYYMDQLSEMSQSPPPPSYYSATAPPATLAVAAAADDQNLKKNRESSSAPARRLWVKDRSKDWWERVSSPDFPDAEFKRAFRMSRATFDIICEELDPAITKKNTTLRDAIPVHQRVAVCIWRLATGEPLRLVSKKFGLGISTCHKLVLEVCTAIRDILLPKFVHWPAEEEKLQSIKDEFEAVSGIPNVAGSMYTTHIPIIAPKVDVSSYYNKRHTERNQKTSYSVTVQGVVDNKGVFTDVSIGWPGSLTDDQVLGKSTLFKKANAGLLQNNTFVVGGSGYPLMDWVLVPYSHKNMTWAQHAFNEKMDEALRISKEAFCRLKSRWSCLQKRTEVKLQDLPGILGACCVLHNICEMRGEEMDPELRFEVFDDEVIPEDCIRGSAAAALARDRIAHNLFHHGRGSGAAFL
ncbi:hypothetical protein SAY86_009527 [Trapa natans]|uniref:DDE Tnp4 domain-containing protein n=1 Tax=Trapa natans TaxID=22666 RepID=A0AAN7L507_TRANT|nr:hypothetical protein SAY86_009527 [Trapa natans]